MKRNVEELLEEAEQILDGTSRQWSNAVRVGLAAAYTFLALVVKAVREESNG